MDWGIYFSARHFSRNGLICGYFCSQAQAANAKACGNESQSEGNCNIWVCFGVSSLSDIPSCLVLIQEALCFAALCNQCQNNASSYYLTTKFSGQH